MSTIIPLEDDVWWHPDEDGPRPESRPDATPGVASTTVASTAVASRAATLPATTIIRPTAFRPTPIRDRLGNRAGARPRYHPGAVFDSTPVRRGAARICLGLLLGLVAVGLTVVGLTVNTRFAA